MTIPIPTPSEWTASFDEWKKYRVTYGRSNIDFYCNHPNTVEYLVRLYSPVTRFQALDELAGGDIRLEALLLDSSELSQYKGWIRQFELKRIVLHGGRKPEFYCTGLSYWLPESKYILIEDTESIVLIDKRKREVRILSERPEALMKDVERILLDILGRGYEENHEAFHFHSSAAEMPGTGGSIVFVGDKHAGKTTFLTHMLLKFRFHYVSNDNCFMSWDRRKDKMSLMPWGYYYKVKEQTLQKYPHIYSNMMGNGNTRRSSDSKITLYTDEMLDMFNVQFSEISYVSAIVYLRYSKNGETAQWERITDPHQYKAIIDSNTFVPHDPEHTNFLELQHDFAVERIEAYHRFTDMLYDSIPLYEFRYSEGWEMQFAAFLENELYPLLRSECSDQS